MTISNVQAVLETQSKLPAAEAATAPTGSWPAHLQGQGRLLSTAIGLYCDAKWAQQLTPRCCSAGQDPREVEGSATAAGHHGCLPKRKSTAERLHVGQPDPSPTQTATGRAASPPPPPPPTRGGWPRDSGHPMDWIRPSYGQGGFGPGWQTRPESTLLMGWPDPVMRRVGSLSESGRPAAAPGRGCRGTDGPARATGRVHSGPVLPGPARRTGPRRAQRFAISHGSFARKTESFFVCKTHSTLVCKTVSCVKRPESPAARPEPARGAAAPPRARVTTPGS